MHKKRIGAVVLMMFMLNSSVIADTTFNAIDTNTTTIQSEEVKLNTDNLIIIPDNKELVNATILRSINNNISNAYYRPKFKDIPNLEENIYEETDIGLIYTGEFNNNYASINSIKHTRELEILGYDITVSGENYDMVSDTYTAKVMSGILTESEAVMALYKALDTSMFNMQYRYTDILPSNIKLGKTPFIKMTGNTDIKISGKKYYTDVFVTRTLPEKYWKEAYKDGICTTKNINKNKLITTAEFIVKVKELLELKGEPVIRDEEKEYLLAFYGSELPYNLTDRELDAVTFLWIRGIVDGDVDFNKELDVETMLTILSRAKDINSRLTLKHVEYPYIPELLELGYYPGKVTHTSPPIQDVRLTVNPATINYYDYLIEVKPLTTFYTNNNVKNNGMYTSNIYGEISNNPMHNSKYMGIVGDYYHFRIPRTISNREAISSNYLTINSTNKSDFPENYNIEVGGGIYTGAEIIVYPSVYNNSNYKLKVPDSLVANFPIKQGYSILNKVDDYYVIEGLEVDDIEIFEGIHLAGGYGNYEIVTDRIKLNRQTFKRTEFKDEYYDLDILKDLIERYDRTTYLSNSTMKSILEFHTTNIDALYWDGKSLSTYEGDILKSLGDNKYELQLTGRDPYGDVLSLLTVSSTDEDGAHFPTYIKQNQEILVPLSYLQHNNLATDMYQLSENKYVLYSNESNILLDLVNRRIVAGSTVTELHPTDKSPLVIMEPNSGEFLIDYRAVIGLTRDFLIIKDDVGNASITVVSDKEKNVNSNYRWEVAQPLLGEYSMPKIQATENYISLESSYPIANHILYRDRNSALSDDYLLVFKPRLDYVNVNNDKKNLLADRFNTKLGDGEDVDVYLVTPNVKSNNKYIKQLDKNTIVRDDFGYKYKLPKSNEFDYTEYINGTTTTTPIPIIREDNGRLVNLNINLLIGSAIDDYPISLVNTIVKNRYSKLRELGGLSFNESAVDNFNMRLAPVGVQYRYFEYLTQDIKNIADKSNIVYYGTMPVNIRTDEETYKNATKYLVTANDFTLDKLKSEDIKLNEIFRGINYSYFAVTNENESSLINGEREVENSKLKTNVDLNYQKIVRVDVNKKLIDTKLTDIEWMLSLVYILTIKILPRILMTYLTVFGTLCLGSDMRLIVKFCEEVFDFYYYFSFKQVNVYTVRKWHIWLTIVIGGSIFYMVEMDTIREIFEWLMKGLVGITNI